MCCQCHSVHAVAQLVCAPLFFDACFSYAVVIPTDADTSTIKLNRASLPFRPRVMQLRQAATTAACPLAAPAFSHTRFKSETFVFGAQAIGTLCDSVALATRSHLPASGNISCPLFHCALTVCGRFPYKRSLIHACIYRSIHLSTYLWELPSILGGLSTPYPVAQQQNHERTTNGSRGRTHVPAILYCFHVSSLVCTPLARFPRTGQ
jgi:hypothetical protein